MNRLLVIFMLVMSMVLAAGDAMAHSDKWYGQNTNATISEVVWNNISGNHMIQYGNTVNGVNGFDRYSWGSKNRTRADVHGMDSKFDLDVKKHSEFSYYGYELNYLHMDFDTAKKGLAGAQIAPSRLQAYISSDFSFGGYANEHNPTVGTVGTYVDFHYLETTRGTLIYTAGNSFKLGSLSYGGKDYFFYAVNDMSRLYRSELEGCLYEQALANLGGSSVDPDLYGWFAKPGETVHFKFDIIVADTDFSPATSAVPVPGAIWLMGTGLAGLVALRRRNK